MIAPQPHILVVTRTSDVGDGLDENEYDLECPGVTDACRAWFPCELPDCPATTDRDALWNDPDAHGVEHHNIDSEWAIPTDRCLYVGHDQMPAAAEYVARKLAPGRYPVRPIYEGDGDISLDLVDAP